MSHFAVVVIGDDYEKQLAPYHEFECTGRDDEYVIDVDKTEEARNEYESQTSKVCRHKETGETVCAFDNRLYRSPNEEERRDLPSWDRNRKVKDVPDCWEEITIPTTEAKTFREFLFPANLVLGHAYSMPWRASVAITLTTARGADTSTARVKKKPPPVLEH